MKKILFLLVALSAVSLSSCLNDYLEVKSLSEYTDDVIFSSAVETEAYVHGIYNVIMMNNSYRNRLGMYHGVNSDTEYRSGMSGPVERAATSNAREAIALYVPTAGMADGYNNPGSDNPWSYLYEAIEKCNVAIKNINEYGSPNTDPDMAYLLGEVLTLRAFFYFDLIRWWGDVPARFDPVSAETITIPKSSRAVIYERLIADLGEAAGMVPWNGEIAQTATTQRVSKAFVKGLRARMCLAAAGKAMFPDGAGAKIDYIFADEAVRRGFYDIARRECSDVIAGGKYSLDADFTDIFRSMCRYDVSAGREAIFQLPYNKGNRGQMYYYFGLRWPNDGKYVTGAITGIGGNVRVVPTLFYDFDRADLRRDASIAPYTMIFEGGVTKPEITNVTEFQLAKWRADYMNEGDSFNNNDDGMAPLVMRYADILLMYAEADLYLGESDGAEKLNEVRRRAFGGSAAYDLTLTLDNIKKERAFEFCGENIRKFDLIRWGELGSSFEAVREKMQALKDGTGDYAGVPQKIYWRLTPAVNSLAGIEIYGLNRGETQDKTATDPTGGWTDEDWTDGTVTEDNGTPANLADDVVHDRINETWIEGFLAHGDPDKRQLLPIMNVILNSNPELKNDYGY